MEELSHDGPGPDSLAAAMAAHTSVSMLLIRDADGTIVAANPAAERAFGYSAGALSGRHISSVNAPTDLSPEERGGDILGALQRDGAWHGDIENVRKNGSTFWSHADVVAFEDPDRGRLWLSTHVDVSGRKESEDALRTAEALYRSVFEDAPCGVAVTDSDLNLISANSSFRRLMGIDEQELQGKALADLFELAPGALQELQQGEVKRLGVEVAGRGPVAVTIGLGWDSHGVPREAVVLVDEGSAASRA